jgi:hypothetical protein
MSVDYSRVFSQFEDAVADRVADAYRAERYVDGDDAPSELALREAVYRAIVNDCVVRSKTERSRKALTRGALYTRTFPHGPGAQGGVDDLGRVEREAFEQLASTVWGLTQTTRSGWIQRRFEADERTLVLCRTKVHRPTDKLLAVYATDNEALIMEDGVDKEIKAFVRRASMLRKDLDMILHRHPRLRAPVAAQLALEMRKVDAELALDPGRLSGGERKEPRATTVA